MSARLKRSPGLLDRSRQAAPQILETLRARILSLDLPPNTLLSRATLQAEFGVSQTPLRDALMKLEEEGLVEVYPQHATLVARIDIAAARQAHFLRQAIEYEAVRHAATGATEEMIARLDHEIGEQARCAAAGDHTGFAASDRAFHRVFYDAARVPQLWIMVRKQSGHMDRLRQLHLPLPGKIEQIQSDHRAILDAIVARDPDRAAQALRAHLSGTLSIIDRIREQYPNYLLDE